MKYKPNLAELNETLLVLIEKTNSGKIKWKWNRTNSQYTYKFGTFYPPICLVKFYDPVHYSIYYQPLGFFERPEVQIDLERLWDLAGQSSQNNNIKNSRKSFLKLTRKLRNV